MVSLLRGNSRVCEGLLVFLISCTSVWRHVSINASDDVHSEVKSQLIAWTAIYFVARFLTYKTPHEQPYQLGQSDKSYQQSRTLLWTAPLAIGSQLISWQNDIVWILPLTTIAVLLVSIIAPPTPSKAVVENLDEEKVPLTTDNTISGPDLHSSVLLSHYGLPSAPSREHEGYEAIRPDLSQRLVDVPRLGVVILTNIFASGLLVFASHPSVSQSTLLISLLYLLCRVLSVVAVMRDAAQKRGVSDQNATIGIAGLLINMARPSILLLSGMFLQNWTGASFNLTVLCHAFREVVWWTCIVSLLWVGNAHTTSNTETIASSIALAYLSKSSVQSAYYVLVLVATTIQAVIMSKSPTKVQKFWYGFLLIVGLYLSLQHYPRVPSSPLFDRPISQNFGHPIENLAEDFQTRFDATIERQSTTVEAATMEYRRRYRREPPLGFPEWFRLAQENQFELIDEFDTLMASMEPFHGISPAVLSQRISKIVQKFPSTIMKYNVTNGTLAPLDIFADVADRMTNHEWLKIIPYNVSVAFNVFDEAMISAPWEDVQNALDGVGSVSAKSPDLTQSNVAPVLMVGGQSAWAATSHACSAHSPARQLACDGSDRNVIARLSFVNNVTRERDICENCQLQQQEGFLFSPQTLNVAHELAPIWSANKPSNFHDILCPSSYYIRARPEYHPEHDPPWHEKDNKVYWAGTATGGHATDSNWHMMQRQRLVLKTQDPNSTEPIYLLRESPTSSTTYTPFLTTMSNVSHLFSTRISRVVQCEPAACTAQKLAFHIDPSDATGGRQDSIDAAYAHKFLLDIDGNAFSGRFYRLLKSNSMVIKQTIFKEWHDDRLWPWVHYVPVSTGFDELPEMARWFGTTERGDEVARRIARASSEWHDKVLRDVDLQLVWLRLLLEYGRLMNPGMEG